MSSVTYSGNGVQTDFNYSFPVISTTHIVARVNGSVVSATFPSTGVCRISPAPAVGTNNVTISRETPASALVTWGEGVIILGADLNKAQLQALYVAEEARRPIAIAIGSVTTGAPGSSASATLGGAYPNFTLDLTIPQGLTGATGAPGSGSGDVTGPASAVDNHVVLFNGSTGKVIKTAGYAITATGQSVITAATQAAARTALGLGSLATLSAVPAATESAVGGLEIATTVEAQGGTVDNVMMTPLKTAQAIAALAGATAAGRLSLHAHYR